MLGGNAMSDKGGYGVNGEFGGLNFQIVPPR